MHIFNSASGNNHLHIRLVLEDYRKMRFRGAVLCSSAYPASDEACSDLSDNYPMNEMDFLAYLKF